MCIALCVLHSAVWLWVPRVGVSSAFVHVCMMLRRKRGAAQEIDPLKSRIYDRNVSDPRLEANVRYWEPYWDNRTHFGGHGIMREVALFSHATRRYRSKSEKIGRPPRAPQEGLAVSRTPARTPPSPCIMPPLGTLQLRRISQRSPPQSPADRADRRRSCLLYTSPSPRA